MSEGERIAYELIQGVLEDEVYNVSKYDIASRGRTLTDHTIIKDTNNFDFCYIIRENFSPTQILSNYSLLCNRAEVIQLKCVEQMASGYCGHYSLHYALCIMEMCQSTDIESVLAYINETLSVGSVWRRYWLSMSYLISRATIEQSWPWTVDYVQSGDMERSFLRHLLDVDPHLSDNKDKLIVMQYSYGSIQNSFSTVCEIQDKITSFVESPTPAYLVFILGVTNHWVTLLAYKTLQGGEDGSGQQKVGIIYMDSNNVPVLRYSDKDIEEHIVEQEQRRIKEKGRGYENWKKNVIRQAYIDQRSIVHKISNYITGNVDMRQEVIEEYTGKLLKSFNEQVHDNMLTHGIDYYIPLLINWMDLHYPAKILQDTLVPLVDHMSMDNSMSLSLMEWAEQNIKQLRNVNPSGINCVDSFLTVLTVVMDKCYLMLQ